MQDNGSNYTDKELEKLEKKIKTVYNEAQKDIEDKLSVFFQKFDAKQRIYLEKVKNGEITQEQYQQWVKGQVFQSKQWQAKRDQIIEITQNVNKEAVNMINGGTINVFAENANWSHYDMEHTEGINFGFGLYDSHTVTNLIKNDPQVLPKWKVNEKKDYVWNGKKVDNAITQGIIQGEGLKDISIRLATALKSNNQNTMLTFARTVMTGAQNAGRNQGLMDAKDLGINVTKVWMATLDNHTRVSHQNLDGEEQKVGDKWHPFKFSNGCRYPGDPLGPAHEVYNCRCTLVSDVKDYPSKFKRYDNINGVPVDKMTYKDWKESKSALPIEPPVVPVVDPKQEFIKKIINSATTNQMTAEQKKQFEEEVLSNMSSEHLQLYDAMTKFHASNDYNHGNGGWYDPSIHRVEMTLSSNQWEKKMGRLDSVGAWKTKFHEELHQLDHILSISLGNGRYGAVTACENDMWSKVTPLGKRLREAISKDIIIVMNKAIDEYNNNRSGMSSFKPLKHITDLTKPISREAKVAFFEYLSNQTSSDGSLRTMRNKAVISPFTDAVGLMTRGRINPYANGYWGHDASYQKDKGPNGATSECFAEIGSHIMRNDTEALSEIEKWMPNSVAEYRSALTELWEYIDENGMHY